MRGGGSRDTLIRSGGRIGTAEEEEEERRGGGGQEEKEEEDEGKEEKEEEAMQTHTERGALFGFVLPCVGAGDMQRREAHFCFVAHGP